MFVSLLIIFAKVLFPELYDRVWLAASYSDGVNEYGYLFAGLPYSRF